MVSLQFDLAQKKKIDMLTRGILVATILIATIPPTIDQWRLFPYSYAYFNEFATISQIDDRWPTDYWDTSMRALIARADSDLLIDCRGKPPEPERDRLPLVYPEKWYKAFPSDLSMVCGSPSGDPYLAYRRLNVQDHLFRPDQFYLVGVNRHGVKIPDNCVTEYTEKRYLLGRELTIGWLARCYVEPRYFNAYNRDLNIQELDPSNVSLLFGWSNIEPWGVWTDGTFAQIVLRTNEAAHAYEIMLNIRGYVTPEDPIRIVRLRINNRLLGDLQLTRVEGPKLFRFRFDIEPDEEYINLSFEVQNPLVSQNPGDGRLLGVGLSSFRLNSLDEHGE